MARYEFTKGLHDLGNGCFAYLQPNGGWGWSNAGLIVSRGQNLLVDTLTDVPLTRQMLDEMKAKALGAASIEAVVITHANPDHYLGNQLVAESTILATVKTQSAIAKFNPEMLTAMQRDWEKLGDSGWFFHETTNGKFQFDGIQLTPPNQVFEQEKTLRVGDKTVIVKDLGPAHTESDVIVYVPEDKVVYTGDLLFNRAHPVIWEGPFHSWIAACDYILDLNVEIVVPGHGPVTDKSAVRAFRHYFEYVYTESRKRFDAGMGFYEAAKDIQMDEFKDWIDGERLVASVYTAYDEFNPSANTRELREPTILGLMGRWVKECGWGHARR